MSQFLADENLPLLSIQMLREAGYSVEAVAEFAAGVEDAEILRHAVEHGQIVMTFDRDFGELIYHRNAPVPPGVIYLRIVARSPKDPGQVLLNLLNIDGLELIGRFTVVERERIRQRPLLNVL
ncbi:MAG TPA: DUF5615 family PIN-like protein [Longimicrobiaceae bacterium]|nr:DUF5615 family PIN-like protein [Longimicrobiaceae bacterium]